MREEESREQRDTVRENGKTVNSSRREIDVPLRKERGRSTHADAIGHAVQNTGEDDLPRESTRKGESADRETTITYKPKVSVMQREKHE